MDGVDGGDVVPVGGDEVVLTGEVVLGEDVAVGEDVPGEEEVVVVEEEPFGYEMIVALGSIGSDDNVVLLPVPVGVARVTPGPSVPGELLERLPEPIAWEQDARRSAQHRTAATTTAVGPFPTRVLMLCGLRLSLLIPIGPFDRFVSIGGRPTA